MHWCYVLSLPVVHKSQTIPLHLALSCADASIFSQLYLNPLSRFLFAGFSSKCSLAARFSMAVGVPTVILVHNAVDNELM